ncbi:hypothetical protein E2C06_13345 [Dankookia rubra]|uniref:Uncharacterized protein n=1 Tax=Dankookia rubra TaxID=1442381 RepID=A0A4R5QFV4_9PROT|nr:DUF6519 domain-containing protein [Dankookia rubra]TDH62152.1 hypothetical protein E2C06_13345 [Dankookia rubra]
MKGDFSRFTFRPLQHYARVLQQQGRPLVDADWNEQAAILLHRLRVLTGDLTGGGGQHWAGPFGAGGFEIRSAGRGEDVEIGQGRYYVNGLCVECEAATSFTRQPLPPDPLVMPDGKAVRDAARLVFLDAWEAVVGPLDDPYLLDPALGGLDTALRTQVVWQVRMHPLVQGFNPKAPDWAGLRTEAEALVRRWQDQPRGRLKIRLEGPAAEAGRRGGAVQAGRFRGPENLLYRIELHRGGPAGEARFKWSRDNGARLLPLASLEGKVAQVVPAAREEAGQLARGTWVEPCDRADRLLGLGRDLVRVDEVDQATGRIMLSDAPPEAAFRPGERSDMALRRWDHLEGRGGAPAGPDGIAVVEGTGEAHWFDLEDGIQVQFEPSTGEPHTYRAGDHWMIPARTADEGILLRNPAPQPPDGVAHAYAPLALYVPQSGEVMADYRPSFQSLTALQDQVTLLAEGLEDLRAQVAALQNK